MYVLVSKNLNRLALGVIRRCLQFSFHFFPSACRRVQAAHPEQHQHLQVLPEHGHRRAERALQQAVRALQVLAVPQDEDRVEVQRVPGPVPHPGEGAVWRRAGGRRRGPRGSGPRQVLLVATQGIQRVSWSTMPLSPPDGKAPGNRVSASPRKLAGGGRYCSLHVRICGELARATAGAREEYK